MEREKRGADSLPPSVASRMTRVPQTLARIPARRRRRRRLLLPPVADHVREIDPGPIAARHVGLERVLDLGPDLADEAVEVEDGAHDVALLHHDLEPHRVPRVLEPLLRGPAGGEEAAGRRAVDLVVEEPVPVARQLDLGPGLAEGLEQAEVVGRCPEGAQPREAARFDGVG